MRFTAFFQALCQRAEQWNTFCGDKCRLKQNLDSWLPQSTHARVQNEVKKVNQKIDDDKGHREN